MSKTYATSEEYTAALPVRDDGEGTLYMRELYRRTFRHGDQFNDQWPDPYARLFRLYKRSSRDFLRHVYTAAVDLLPAAEMHALAWPWQSGREDEPWEVETPRDCPDHSYIVLVDAVVANSSKDRIVPEMMLALQVEVAARRLADAYTRAEREALPFDKRAHGRGVGHELWTVMLAERLEDLRPEYERWYDNAEASLAAVCDKVVQISLDTYIR